MDPSSQARRQIRTTIRDRLDQLGGRRGEHHALALNLFFELSLEYESLRDFKTLCVLVPEVCLDTPASLYLRDPKGALRLRRTSNSEGTRQITFPEPACPQPTTPIRDKEYVAFPICETSPPTRLLGVLCLHKRLDPAEEAFFQDYVHRMALIMAVKQAAVGNRQRLTFVNNLVRDIGHNVIVPNMHFKLLFLEMERCIHRLGHAVEAFLPAGQGDQDRQGRNELTALVEELRSRQASISRRFQQSSLFLESLLRRSHFEKGRYELVLRTCRFKSQIIEPQIERFLPLLRARGVRVGIAPDARIDEDMVFEADLGLMAQVFANLLANAVKYTRTAPGSSAGTEKLLLYGWESEPMAFGPGHPGVRLYVATTGPAIAAEEVPRLFDPDFRSADTDTMEGTGHGLFFVKQIVELHRGRVRYAYEPPMNVFSIVLPAQPRIPGATEATCPNPS